jgi:uncharacterized protein YcaQ
MPYLMGDRLVARVDLRSDRKACVLIASPHCEDWCDGEGVAAGLGPELHRLAAWLGLAEVRVTGTDAFAAAVAGAAGGPAAWSGEDSS